MGSHDQVKGKNAEPGGVIWNIESADVKGDFDRLRSAGAAVIRELLPARQPDGTASYVAITTRSRTRVERRHSGSRRHACWPAIATYRQRTAEG